MNKPYLLIILIAAVVFVSGCAAQQQADLVKTSFEKAAALEKGTGYAADYKMEISFTLGDSLKSYINSNPSTSAQGLGALEKAKLTMQLSEAVADSGAKQKLSIDMTSILALSSANAPSNMPTPKKYVLSVYKSGTASTVCVELDTAFWKTQGQDISVPVCSEITDSSALSGLGGLLSQIYQYSSSSPTALIETLGSLYNQGLLKVGAMRDDSAAGRPCKSAAFTIEDLSKVSDKDLAKIIGSSAQSSGIPVEALTQTTKLLKTLVKEISEDLCFDSESGLPTKLNAMVSMDLSGFLKPLLKSMDPSKAETFPDNAIMKSIVSMEATSVTIPPTSAQTSVPSTAKVVSELELENLLTPQGQTRTDSGLKPAA